MTDQYTTADFTRIAWAWELQEEGGHRDAVKIIRAALRIASRVMADGVIGAALFADWDGEEPDRSAEEVAVRAALLEDAT